MVFKNQLLSFKFYKRINRLAAATTTKVSSDEGAIENISIHGRPMRIAEAYSHLITSTSLDTKSKPDDVYPDDTRETERFHNARSGDRLAIRELQERLAVSESMFGHDRSIFEEQIKHLSEELERTKKSLEEVTAENEKNVRYILLVIILPLAMDDKDVDIHMLQMLKDNFD